MKIIKLMSVIVFAQVSQVIYSGCVRGAGDTRFAAMSSLISISILRPLTTFFFCNVVSLGVIGAWIAVTIDQCTRMILMRWRFASGKWSKIKI